MSGGWWHATGSLPCTAHSPQEGSFTFHVRSNPFAIWDMMSSLNTPLVGRQVFDMLSVSQYILWAITCMRVSYYRDHRTNLEAWLVAFGIFQKLQLHFLAPHQPSSPKTAFYSHK